MFVTITQLINVIHKVEEYVNRVFGGYIYTYLVAEHGGETWHTPVVLQHVDCKIEDTKCHANQTLYSWQFDIILIFRKIQERMYTW